MAFVLYVHTDGSFWVSEQNCNYGSGGIVYKKFTSTDQGFIYEGSVPYRETRTPTQIIQARKGTALNDRNPHGWTSSPESEFGNYQTLDWWYCFNESYVYHAADGTPYNCYLAELTTQNPTYNAGIVYDALGGARQAFCLGWEKWDIWRTYDYSGNDPQPTCSGQQVTNGGPHSNLGMPITNSYQTSVSPEKWRQDFQKGYIENGTVYGYSNCAPGWASGEIWNSRYSYLFADAYDRNGGARDVGNAVNRVHVLSGNILIQDFSGGNDGSGMLMYDMENWDHNPCATNEAYWVYGNIKAYYDSHGGVNVFGCAMTDRIQYLGFACQDFKNSKHQMFRIYEYGFPAMKGLHPCIPGVHAAGPPTPLTTFDFDADGKADVWDRTSTGEFHLDFASDNLSEWDTTFYGYGGSQDTPAPADYDGDGRCDIVVLRNSGNKWLMDFASNGFGAWDDSLSGYGTSADYPCPGDFDGDGITDISVRDADGDWHIDYFAQGTGFGAWDTTFYGYGGQYDRPAPADYDGDGICDFAVLRNSDRKYLIDYADDGFGSWNETALGGYGGYSDYPCPADYDNDGSDDIAVLNTGDRILRVDRTGNGFTGWDYVLGGYGGHGDRPMPADYDGDGWDDIATFYAAYDQICLDYASDNYGEWDWCDDGPDHPTNKRAVEQSISAEFSESQVYPNPFNAGTTVSYTLLSPGFVKLDVYNILGQKIASLVDTYQEAGQHTVSWAADQQASGIYFARLSTPAGTGTKKMVLVK